MKYIALLVIVALTAIFAYQAYWLVGMYGTMRTKMKADIDEAIRISDYAEMMHRVKVLRKRNDINHGEVELSAGYDGDTGGGKIASKTITKDSAGNANKRELSKILKRDGSANINYDTDTKKAKVSKTDATEASLQSKEGFSTILKDQKDMQALASYMQRGLHDGLSVVADPDLKYFDKTLTKALERLGIDTTHQLYYLNVYTLEDTTKVYTDTLACIGKPVEGKTDEYNYNLDLATHYTYRLLLPPTTTVTLRQMSGILATSLFILVVLALAFWYLIHTILKQKTLDEMKSDFTNNITHELKTPIAVAYAANDALLNFNAYQDETKRREYLEICQEQLQRLGGLVEQILSMSMERRKTMTLHIDDVEAKPVIMPLVAQHKLKADKSVEIYVEAMPDEATVKADRQHMQNIISNLIDNAIRYSHGSVNIRIQCTPGRIVVSDNGIGIPKDKLPYIFDKFYRVPQGNLHEVKGYGLGLFYVKSLMEKMGGTIAVESVVSKGTTFTLNFKQQV